MTPPRNRRARGSITNTALLDAAEELLAAGQEPSVRAVTAAIDASAMSFYRHFASKDELVDALLDRVLHRFEEPPTDPDWVAELGSLARAHRALLQAHAWALPALFSRPDPGSGAARIGERVLGVLDRGGVSSTRAFAVFSGMLALNYGWTSFSAVRSPDAIRTTSPDEHPLTTALETDIRDYGSDAHYEIALSAYLAGVAALAPTSPDLEE